VQVYGLFEDSLQKEGLMIWLKLQQKKARKYA
jgi:hypothetical protein